MNEIKKITKAPFAWGSLKKHNNQLAPRLTRKGNTPRDFLRKLFGDKNEHID